MPEKAPGLAGMDNEVQRILLYLLRVLKKGAGLTPEKITDRYLAYLSYFGATTIHNAYKMLRDTLNSMDASQLYVQALLNAYGGEGLASELKARRKHFADKHDLKVSRVVNLEDRALSEMVRLLDEAATGKSPMSSSEQSRVEELLAALIKATREQTAVLNRLSGPLDRDVP